MLDPFTIDLRAEFDQAVRNLTPAHIRHLARYGVSEAAIYEAGGLGVAHILPTAGTYAPDPSGSACIIVPLWYPSPFAVDCTPHVLDLIAFKPCDPFAWWHRRGFEGLELGAWWHLWSLETGNPIRHFASPLAWLQGGTEGVCNLDAAAAWAARGMSFQNDNWGAAA